MASTIAASDVDPSGPDRERASYDSIEASAMNNADNKLDRLMMTRCIALSKKSGKVGEYPYGAVICRNGTVVAESINRVTHDGDVTRHAEVVAISSAQRALRTVSLDDCEIYANAEPCVFCCYAIRESRIRRVVYGLSSPHMGGFSRWKVLTDLDLCTTMPEVFAPPPEVVSGYMSDEAERALMEWNPLIASIIERRGLFGSGRSRQHVTTDIIQKCPKQPPGLRDRAFAFLRRNLFDRFGRR